MQSQTNYVDLVISAASSGALRKTAKHYRTCTLSRRGDKHYINLQLPEHVQEMILEAYKSGKQVRIFA